MLVTYILIHQKVLSHTMAVWIASSEYPQNMASKTIGISPNTGGSTVSNVTVYNSLTSNNNMFIL